ncbi:LacI family transcriptional regulator [Anaerotaenia torta]|uniref:LacI family DNA-binding transcriptional regulator n=1 Tax=Anaerotaenia torta TaxID=433293 RepID=UPI003D205DE8
MAFKSKEIAKMLGISPASVSLVLNNKPGVSEATRNKVFSLIKELGYEDLLPETAEETKTILFLVYRKNGANTEASPYFSQIFSDIIEGVEKQARNSGYKLMITYADTSTIQSEVAKIKGEQMEGLLLLATEMVEEQMDLFTEMHVPTVIIDNYMETKDIDSVAINNEQGVSLAISYLVSMGHRDIGYLHVNGNAHNFSERYYGFLRAAREYQLAAGEERIIEFSSGGGDAAFLELKERIGAIKYMPTAFFADNDIIAIYAIRILRELGYQIPGDVSVVGFDNISLSEMLDPPLTTIQTPKYAIGRAAVNTLTDMISGESEGIRKIELKTSLVKRNSVKRLNV